MSKILIAGCGKIGTALATSLTEQGHDVFALRRHIPTESDPRIHWISIDLNDASTLKQLPHGIEYVYYTAAANDYSSTAYQHAYVDGVINLQNHLDTTVTKRCFYISSTAVYGQVNGEIVDETSVTEPTNFSGQTLLDGEAIWTLPVTCIRAAGIYGPGRTRMIDSIRNGDATLSPQPVFTNRIHSDDLVGFLQHCLALEKPHPIYIACDNESATKNDVITWLATQCHVPLPQQTSDENSPQRSNKRCSNTLLRASGYTLLYPTFREGYSELLKTLP